MKTTIRPYEIKDRAACINAFKTNIPLFFTESEITDFENFLIRMENLETDKHYKNTHYYVFLLEDKIIGCGGFGNKENTENMSLAWGLIDNAYHKKGFGKAFLKYRLEQIKLLYPNTTIVLDTTQHSFSFFEKFGFVTAKITNDFYEKGMHRYDMVFQE
jgi:[ribosomal protein S18]-alanine N-acetyltransferase